MSTIQFSEIKLDLRATNKSEKKEKESQLWLSWSYVQCKNNILVKTYKQAYMCYVKKQWAE